VRAGLESSEKSMVECHFYGWKTKVTTCILCGSGCSIDKPGQFDRL